MKIKNTFKKLTNLVKTSQNYESIQSKFYEKIEKLNEKLENGRCSPCCLPLPFIAFDILSWPETQDWIQNLTISEKNDPYYC